MQSRRPRPREPLNSSENGSRWTVEASDRRVIVTDAKNPHPNPRSKNALNGPFVGRRQGRSAAGGATGALELALDAHIAVVVDPFNRKIGSATFVVMGVVIARMHSVRMRLSVLHGGRRVPWPARQRTGRRRTLEGQRHQQHCNEQPTGEGLHAITLARRRSGCRLNVGGAGRHIERHQTDDQCKQCEASHSGNVKLDELLRLQMP